MNRPSHWIIATFAIMGPVLWVWGFTAGFGSQQEGAALASEPRRERFESGRTEAGTSSIEAQLSGRVINELGRPVAGAEIRVIGGSSAAVTRTSGAFEVMVKPRDPYRRIEVTASGFSPIVERCSPADLGNFVARLCAPPPWEAPTVLPLSQKRSALAGEGFVLDADRRPVADVVVTAVETGDTAITDDKGLFRIPIGAPSTSFVAWHPSGRCAAIDAIQTTQSEGLISLGVATMAAGARLSGTVRLPDGAPAAAAAIVLRRHGMLRRILAEDSGAFEILGLVAADYELEVLPTGGALGIKQPLRVEGAGSLQTEFRLVAETPLRVRVVDPSHNARAGAFVLAVDGDSRRAWAQADSEGVATLRGLAAAGATVREARTSDLVSLRIEGVAVEAETTTVVTAP